MFSITANFIEKFQVKILLYAHYYINLEDVSCKFENSE